MPKSSAVDRLDPNEHLRDYLGHYLGFRHAPMFAVLVTGAWGAGKTFQVTKTLDAILGTDGYALVSLNGLASKEQIDEAMFAAVYPWTDNDVARIGAGIGRALLKHARIDLPDLGKAELLKRAGTAVFAFDDLERCRLPITETLGYINQFVERDGAKVVILANEDQIADRQNYLQGKEKLIGRSIEVRADFDAAFSEFQRLIDDPRSRDLFERNIGQIRSVYEQSGLNNLRILQRTMWDFERLHRAFDDRQRAHAAAMAHVLRLFFALSFEHKAGRIDGDDLRGRVSRSMRLSGPSDAARNGLATAGTRYPGLHLADPILSDAVLHDVLARGLVDADAIRTSLDASSWFVVGDEPAWRTTWHSYERPDDEVRSAAERLQAQFASRHYVEPGEVMHVLGQMLWLADLDITGWSRERTVAEGIEYIDDLRAAGCLRSSMSVSLEDLRFGSYAGLGFAQKDTPEFDRLWTHMAEQRNRVAVDQLPLQAEVLAALVETDPAGFVHRIAHDRGVEATLADVPVLAELDPAGFADRLVTLPPLQLRAVLMGLSVRYGSGALSNRLAAERPWFEKLEMALLRRATRMEPFARDRIERNVRWMLSPEIERAPRLAQRTGEALE